MNENERRWIATDRNGQEGWMKSNERRKGKPRDTMKALQNEGSLGGCEVHWVARRMGIKASQRLTGCAATLPYSYVQVCTAMLFLSLRLFLLVLCNPNDTS